MTKQLIIVGLLSLFSSLVIAQENDTQIKQKENPASITKIEFQEQVFEFGELIEGEIIQNVFIFKNTGNEPLIISNAKGSCGCTIPSWPKEPIMPGETADLLVQFNSKGKGTKEGNFQSKRVSITANTDPAISYLTIKGKVIRLQEKENTAKIAKTVSPEIKNPVVDNFEVDSKKVKLFPNPTNDLLNISLKEYSNKKGSIEIYNATGVKLVSKNIEDFSQDLSIDVSDYTPGVYTVSIKIQGMNRIAKRFVVNKNG